MVKDEEELSKIEINFIAHDRASLLPEAGALGMGFQVIPE